MALYRLAVGGDGRRVTSFAREVGRDDGIDAC
jgi:hypothetical protein